MPLLKIRLARTGDPAHPGYHLDEGGGMPSAGHVAEAAEYMLEAPTTQWRGGRTVYVYYPKGTSLKNQKRLFRELEAEFKKQYPGMGLAQTRFVTTREKPRRY